ncbi:PREDICTED: histone-lysine N-methyltransferase SETMAR-like isoform X2 [Dinoponera quadriceps]|uniref:Histone-lysine N-methyltransferase SETMAR-like isoform X2 n=1 Tax=Dinoponera quadriceps TaxID=609295 RepID=A0A6P3WTG5_DINQU|nr:PREDICTED: histone-lysine N-methyltransferase SETMAR-like isoform X2 [Dinoponera quadriceps]
MVKCCFVQGCKSSKYKKTKVRKYRAKKKLLTLFGFPADPILKGKWIEALINSGHSKEYIATISKYSRICNRHFAEDCVVITSNITRLKPNSVPTIFPKPLTESMADIKNIISSDIPFIEMKTVDLGDDESENLGSICEEETPLIKRLSCTGIYDKEHGESPKFKNLYEKINELKLEKKQIRAIFLYEFKKGRKAAEVARSINDAFGPGVANERTVQWWFRRFRDGDESLENERRSGRPMTIDDNHLKMLIEIDPHTTIQELAKELGVSKSTISDHLERIGMTENLDKWVLHELSEKHQNRRLEVCFSLILRNQNDPFLDRIITCDEKWILYDNRRRSAQWSDRNETSQHFSKPKLHQKKTMLTVWWWSAGIIHYSFLSPNKTITAEKYCQEINKMHQKLALMRPALVNRKGPILLHDNARTHVTQLTLQKLNQLGYETLIYPPCSPDLLPTNYHFFKHLDNFLQKKTFNNEAAVQNAFEEFVASRNPEFYVTGINTLVFRWQKCVDSNGSYFDE